MTATPKRVELKNGTTVWRVNFRLTPGGKPTTETFDDENEAAKFTVLVDKVGGSMARAIRNASDGAALDVLTLRKVFDRYITAITPSVSEGTVYHYEIVAGASWLPTLGDLPVSAVTREAIQKWLGDERQKDSPRGGKLATATIEYRLLTLQQALNYAVDEGMISRSPARKMKVAHDREGGQAIFVQPSQFAAILGACPDEWRTLLSVLYGTGLRWSEATALEPRDLDLESRPATLTVSRGWKAGEKSRHYLGTPKSSRSLRTVTLPKSLIKPLEIVARGKGSGDLLFARADGSRLDGLWFRRNVWGPTLDRSKLDIRPRIHDLRHGHASNLIKMGVSLPVIQRRLGHEDIKTTIHTYGHLTPDSFAGAAEAADLTLVQALPQIDS